MKRGEIWTIAGGPDYAGKPRPAIIVQSDAFDATNSIVICPLTHIDVDAEPIRFAVEPSPSNGLVKRSFIMTDKITALPKEKIGRRIGQLEPAAMRRLGQYLLIFLGIAE
jgi:mRNA interferase MazF